MSKSKAKKGLSIAQIVLLIASLIVGALAGAGVGISVTQNENGEYEITTTQSLEFAEEEQEATLDGDYGEITDDYIPTVEEVDGGLFEDEITGTSLVEDTAPLYEDLGWSETYDTSSPQAFAQDTYGKCITANNRYGAQCVSLARVFWWSYANRDVSTCGTGMAKGMMNCATENAGDDFEIYYGQEAVSQIQAGDWLIFGNGQFGHVGMALGSVNNGYVTLLGENQGGANCGTSILGSATNVINISTKNIIGFYRPKAYIPVEEEEEVEEEDTTTIQYEVKAGDTLGSIMKELEGEIDWSKMDEYATHWYSTKYQTYLTVYDGWASAGGYGLFAGDVIEYRD